MREFLEMKQSMVIPRIRHEILQWQSEGFPIPDFISIGPEESLSLRVEMRDLQMYEKPNSYNWDGIQIAGVKIIHSDKSGVWVNWIDPTLATRLAWHRENWRKK